MHSTRDTHLHSDTAGRGVRSIGTVLQKDLGEETAKVAGEMKSYDRDETWTPVKD